MNKAKSKNLFSYAKKNFQEYNENICNEEKERILINVSGALTKCLHCKMDELVEYVDKIVGGKFNLKKPFPSKMEYVENSVFFSEEVSNNLTSLNQQRVNLEHSYTIPSYQEVKDGLKDLELFLKRTEKYMKLPPENIRKKIENSLNKLKTHLKEKKKEDALKTYPLHIKKFLIYCKKDPNLLKSLDANIYVQKVIDKEEIKIKKKIKNQKGM